MELLHSISRSQRIFKMSVNILLPNWVWWCSIMSQSVMWNFLLLLLLSSRSRSQWGSCDSNVVLSTIFSELLIPWQPNLVWWYIIISQSVLWKVPGLTFSWWGCYGLCHRHELTKLAHSFLFCSCVCFCLYGPFNNVSFHKFSWQLFTFSLCSSGLNSALLVLSTIYLFIKVSSSPDIILCGWLGLKHQPTNSCEKKWITALRVKVKVKDQNVNFAQMTPSKPPSILFPNWYWNASLWVGVSCKKTDLLFSRSRSLQDSYDQIITISTVSFELLILLLPNMVW